MDNDSAVDAEKMEVDNLVVQRENAEEKQIEKSGTPTCNSPVQNKKNIQEKETFQRINYLFQAAQLVTAHSPRGSSVPAFYSSLIHGIAQKSVIRLDPSAKRQLCRGCKGILIPGVSARVRIRSRPQCTVVWTCLMCGTIRRLPAKRGYQLWVDKPEALA